MPSKLRVNASSGTGSSNVKQAWKLS
jgi:hypothetical protein